MEKSDEDFLSWVGSYEDWYRRESQRWIVALRWIKSISLVSTLGSTVAAAALNEQFLAVGGKWVIVAASLLSAITSEFVAQFQVRRMEELRESGRVEAAHLLRYVQDKTEEFASNREKIFKMRDEVRERIRILDQTQHERFVAINSAQEKEDEDNL